MKNADPVLLSLFMRDNENPNNHISEIPAAKYLI